LLKNSFFSSGGFVFISLIGLVITPFLVKGFGLEQYGVYVLVTGVFGYYGIFDFGLGQGVIKFVSEFNATNSKKEINDAINSVFTFQLLMGAILSGVLWLVDEQIIALLNISEAYYDTSVAALDIAAIGFFFSMLAGTFGAAIKGLEEFGAISVVDSLSNLMLNVLLFVVVMQKFGVKEAVWVNVLMAFIQLFTYTILFKRYNSSYRFRLTFNTKIIRKFVSFSSYLFLSKINGIISKHGVRFIISYYLGPTAVTIFVVPSKLLGAIGGVLYSASGVLFPYISRLATEGKKEGIKRAFLKASLVFAGISIPVSLFVVFFSKPIMALWMGADFAEKSWLVLSIITLSSLIGGFTAIPYNTLLGLGKSKTIFSFSIMNVISYTVLLPLLTKTYGVYGAALALLLTSTTVIGFVWYKTTRAIEIGVRDYLSFVYRIHVIPILGIIVITAGLYEFPINNYIFELFVGSIVFAAYYLFLLKKRVLII
jgi:O-antigen/teichoic acid export membrane protein